jgi:predicted ribosomally synthesized peptide with SipW-like signal peptide
VKTKMKKLLISLVTIGAVSGLGFYATNAFFSDKETSTGNTFTAGAIDLRIDSTSHYDGMICSVRPTAINPFIWKEESSGSSTNPTLIGKPCNGTWLSKNLVASNRFFDYTDLKPGDSGETTISLKVEDNNAWMCSNIKTTESANPQIRNFLTFVWWIDNGGTVKGNNILDTEERTLFGGPVTLAQMLTSPVNFDDAINLTLADSRPLNVFTGAPGPITGNETNYIGVGWCFGKMTLTPGVGRGFTCDGSDDANNVAQGDNVTADISFSAIQSRNNDKFECPETAKLY